MRGTVAERFWAKVNKNGHVPEHRPELGPHWLWTGCTSKDPKKGEYGRMGMGDGTSDRAHRISWVLHFGPIPEGMCVLHACDLPCCVNPAHLFLGTIADNNADRDAKGRDVSANALKTHCPLGHPYDGHNLLVNNRGNRDCRICENARQRAKVAKLAERRRLNPTPRKQREWVPKTHCPKGHLYAGDNLRINPSGAYVCRTCCREKTRAARAARRAS